MGANQGRDICRRHPERTLKTLSRNNDGLRVLLALLGSALALCVLSAARVVVKRLSRRWVQKPPVTLEVILRKAWFPQHAATLRENGIDVVALTSSNQNDILEQLDRVGIPRADAKHILAVALALAGDQVSHTHTLVAGLKLALVVLITRSVFIGTLVQIPTPYFSVLDFSVF